MTRSFRDPAGSCWLTQDQVFRVLDSSSGAACETFLQTPSAKSFLERRQLIGTRRLPELPVQALAVCDELDLQGVLNGEAFAGRSFFEHEKVRFASYPHEWPPEMLWAAGRLTLDLAREALADGYGLKDATPYNILFRGPDPVFIDLPSFELRVAGDPVWQACAQFIRTFLLPLLAHRRWGLTMADIFLAPRDGLQPQEVYPLCGTFERFSPQVL